MCPKETDNWDKLKVHTYNADVKVNIEGEWNSLFFKGYNILFDRIIN